MIAAIRQRLQDLPATVLYRHTNTSRSEASHRVLASVKNENGHGSLVLIGLTKNQMDAYRIRREAKTLFIYDEVIVQPLPRQE
jgi:hypothetical protein